MLTNQDKRKIQGFKKWLGRNEDTANLVFYARRISPRDLAYVVSILEAKGYPLKASGTPIIGKSEDDYRKFIFTLYGAFERVIGLELTLALFEQSVEDLRRWLLSNLFEEHHWWDMIDWETISRKVLARIARNMYEKGFSMREGATLDDMLKWSRDPDVLRVLEESILEALIQTAHRCRERF
jgi:hypothetical protein